MVKILFDKRSNMIDIKNDKGRTPLSFAAEANGKFLVEKFHY